MGLLGRDADVAEKGAIVIPGQGNHHWMKKHALAITAALLVCMLAFFYTGETHVYLVIGSGMAAAFIFYIAAYIQHRRGH
jgi:heme O synthase-like polyprenyltransferase